MSYLYYYYLFEINRLSNELAQLNHIKGEINERFYQYRKGICRKRRKWI